jgi:dTDP-4-dehydrorhamnose 3,5-epimerase
MKIKSNFKDLFLIKNRSFKDNRGYFKELIRENVINKNFPFLVMSFSKKKVIRGLHIQTINSQGKFISVLKGKIFDVAIDLRKNSKTFGRVYRCILSEKNNTSIYVPPGFAHGFQALENENYIVYSCTKYRNKKSETTIKFDDKELNIKWPIKKFIISAKDKKGISLSEFKKKYL